MADARIRRQIALIAARLMYERSESEYFTAKRKAARQLGVDYRFRPKDLPSNAEIREQIQSLACFYEGDARTQNLQQMRLAALHMLRLLDAFRPRLIGSVLTGHVRQGSDIDLHVFSDHLSAVTTVLEENNLQYDVQRKRVLKQNEERVFTHLHVAAEFNLELTLYDRDKVNYPFKSSITGKLIERASAAELEALLAHEYPELNLDQEIEGFEDDSARFALYRRLLEPLQEVKQSPKWHPEGDALYHSLQVFDLARDSAPYDEEFLLAALLHDVGKAIDPPNHPQAAVDALGDSITERTVFLILYHMEAQAYFDGSLGHRARLRLQACEHFEELMLLREIDVAGRRRGVVVAGIDDALNLISDLSDDW